MDPSNETYASRIETAVYNALLRQMVGRAGIRYWATMEGKQTPPNNANTCCEGQGSRAIGSLPEYVFSLGTETIYVNLFAQAVLSFNAPVASGRGRALPPPPPLEPPTPLPPPSPSPPITYRSIGNGSFYAGSVIGLVVAANRSQCEAACTRSEHPNRCMGFTWLGPPPPPQASPIALPKTACTTGCTLVAMPQRTWHVGLWSPNGNCSLPNASCTLATCKAACLLDPMCVQLTFDDRPNAPCSLYYTITSSYWPGGGPVSAFVKCHAGASDPSCAFISPGNTPGPFPPSPAARGCTLYRAIDTTVDSIQTANVEQFLAVGRRVVVQRDWINPPLPEEEASAAAADSGIVEAKLSIKTRYPYGNAVSMSMAWDNPAVESIATTVCIRMPSWMAAPLAVTINGKTAATAGKPGTFLALNRTWLLNDTIAFELPEVLTLSQYTGEDQISGYEGRRYALKMGPIVLAAVGALDGGSSSITLPLPPSNISSWLVPVPGQPLHFTAKGATGVVFKPMWTIGNAAFTTYPVFAG